MVTRRTALAVAALAACGLGRPGATTAQDASTDGAAGYAIFRVRSVPTPELAEAITPSVMADFVPALREVPGYVGYVLAEDTDNPAGHLTLALTADESGAPGVTAVSTEFVEALDPRFAVELVAQIDGAVRAWGVTARTTAELPPNLAGCAITMRYRESPEGLDMDHVIAQVQESLIPLFADMPGFIMYALVPTESGRAGINIWETVADMDAGNASVGEWAAANQAGTWVGDPVVHTGTISFAELAALHVG